MALTIDNLKVSETRKRVDADIKVSGWFVQDYTAKFRVVAYDEIPEDKVEELLREIHDRKAEWIPAKTCFRLPMRGVNGTGYIMNLEEPESNIL
jgi:hypothetical protein